MLKSKIKAMKNFIKKITSLLIIMLLISLTANAKSFEKEGKIEKEFNIDKNTRIEISNKNSDLQLKVWNKQMVKLECFYKIRANDEDDITKTIGALENIDVDKSSSLLSIETAVFSSIKSTVFSGMISKIAATLSTGTVVNLREYKVEYVLTLPDNHDLTIKQKYSDVNMPNYAGTLRLDLYDVNFYAGQLINAESIKTKYSKLNIEALGNSELDLYDTDVDLGSMGDLKLKSKYSKFEADVVGAVTLDSFDDKFYFTELKSMVGKSKYSDFELGNMAFADLDLYDCELKGKDCGKLKITGKYSGIVMNDIHIFEYPDCYDNNVKARFVGEFSSDSKYTEFEFDHVAGFIDLVTYDDKLVVGKMDEDFYAITINGKYTDVDINILGNPKYFLDVSFKYTKYELPSDVLFSNVDTGSSKFVASGRTEGLKKMDVVKIRTNEVGIRKATIGKISIEQYDGKLSIRK